MTSSARRFGRVIKGQLPSAARDNAIAEAVERLTTHATGARQLPAAHSEIQLFQLTDVSGTVLLGVASTNTPDTDEEITILLPPELIEADDGAGVDYTYTDVNNRNADDGSTSEDQVMHPPYRVGDFVLAHVDETDGDYVDINRAGRAWSVPDS